MLYINTIKNDQKIGKFFERDGTAGEKEALAFAQKPLEEKQAILNNAELRSRISNALKIGKLDAKTGRDISQRLNVDTKALDEITKTALLKLAVDGGWKGLEAKIRSTQTYQQIASNAEKKRTEKSITTSVPTTQPLNSEDINELVLEAANKNTEKTIIASVPVVDIPSSQDTNETISQAVSMEMKLALDSMKQDFLRDYPKAEAPFKLGRSSSDKSWSGEEYNGKVVFDAKGKNFLISSSILEDMNSKNISVSFFVEYLNTNIGNTSQVSDEPGIAGV